MLARIQARWCDNASAAPPPVSAHGGGQASHACLDIAGQRLHRLAVEFEVVLGGQRGLGHGQQFPFNDIDPFAEGAVAWDCSSVLSAS